MLLWPAAIFLSERTAPFAGPSLPTRIAAAAPRYQAAIRDARVQVQALLAERRIPGLAVAVAVQGQTVWSEGFGYADLEKRVPATAQTQFRLQASRRS
jgi:CubicO group peptidase (beta-lactamase class C family)